MIGGTRLRFVVLVCGWLMTVAVAAGDEQESPVRDGNDGVQKEQKESSPALRDDAGLFMIEGTLVDESGAPVANARVRLSRPSIHKPFALRCRRAGKVSVLRRLADDKVSHLPG